MAKTLNVVIVIIIILILIGGGVTYFLFYSDFGKSKAKEPPPPPPKNKAPKAYFSGNSSGLVGQLMRFDGNDSRDDDGHIISYEWDFGDGSTWPTINNSVVNHTYNAAGIYEVNLTVIDNEGATDSYTMDVTIRAEDETIQRTTILLERFGINNQIVETFNVSLFAVSLWGNLTLIGHGAEGEASLEVALLNPDGMLIFSEIKNTTIQQAQVNVEFYFDNPLTIIPGEYEMTATCLKGALFLSYTIEIRY